MVYFRLPISSSQAILILCLLALTLCENTLYAVEAPPPDPDEGKRVYKSVDSQGNTAFSDQPSDEAREISVEEFMTYDGKKLVQELEAENRRSRDNPVEEGPVRYSNLSITYPQNNETIRENAGNISISGQIAPALQSTHRVEIVMDGVTVAQGLSVSLTNVDRGTHQVSLRVVNSTNNSVFQESTPVSFTLQRFSKLHSAAQK